MWLRGGGGGAVATGETTVAAGGATGTGGEVAMGGTMAAAGGPRVGAEKSQRVVRRREMWAGSRAAVCRHRRWDDGSGCRINVVERKCEQLLLDGLRQAGIALGADLHADAIGSCPHPASQAPLRIQRASVGGSSMSGIWSLRLGARSTPMSGGSCSSCTRDVAGLPPVVEWNIGKPSRFNPAVADAVAWPGDVDMRGLRGQDEKKGDGVV